MKARLPRFSARVRGDARRVVQVLLGHHTERLWSFEAAARAGVDPEGVHQMRVQTRRLRAVLRIAQDILPRGVAEALRRRLAALGNKLGAERDADVLGAQLLALAERVEDVGAKRALARRQHRCRLAKDHAHAALLVFLDSAAVVQLRARLEAVVALPLDGEPVDARDFAANAVHRLLKRVRRRARKAHDHDAEALHALRRALKNLRYGVEALRPLLPARSHSLGRRATWLQDRLGAVHDLDVARALLGGNRGLREQLEGERNELLRGVDRRVRRVLERGRDPAR